MKRRSFLSALVATLAALPFFRSQQAEAVAEPFASRGPSIVTGTYQGAARTLKITEVEGYACLDKNAVRVLEMPVAYGRQTVGKGLVYYEHDADSQRERLEAFARRFNGVPVCATCFKVVDEHHVMHELRAPSYSKHLLRALADTKA